MVDSPNIVKIYDVAISDNLKYIVMEFIDGITLKDYIDKVGALGWKEAVHYVRQILTGLTHAHEKGIVHRDIKPQNVMLLRDGKVKVTDFGIAKGPTSENLTMTDKAIGTVNYISPEQASGQSVDEKSDVYSVGIMLYEMLTGKLPFTAESPVAVAMMQVNDVPVAPREHNSNIPVGLEQIILKAMSKKPEERFNCASSMEKALDYFVKNPGTVFSGAPVSSRSAGDKKQNEEEYLSKHRSMFPIILGITTSFFVVVICSLLVMFFSNGGSTQDGFASALDKILGIESNTGEEKKMEVEDFTGNVYNDEIVEQMKSKGYIVKEIKETGYAHLEHGIIVNQNPEAGEIILKQDKVEITLYVNKNIGETNKSMPDCVGSPRNSAIEQIVRKFGPEISRDDIEIIEEFNQSHAPGTVYDCIPQVGAEVDVENDKITLYVSKGKKMKMPMVIDKTENEAREILIAEGIRYSVEYVESEEEVGTVLDASVGTGMEVMEADVVVLKVSKKAFKRPEKQPEVNETQNNETQQPAGESTVADNTESTAPSASTVPEVQPDASNSEQQEAANTPSVPEITPETQPDTGSEPQQGVDALLGMRGEN